VGETERERKNGGSKEGGRESVKESEWERITRRETERARE